MTGFPRRVTSRGPRSHFLRPVQGDPSVVRACRLVLVPLQIQQFFSEQAVGIRQLRELRSCELVAMDMGRLWKSEATEDVSHFLTVYGSILLIEK